MKTKIRGKKILKFVIVLAIIVVAAFFMREFIGNYLVRLNMKSVYVPGEGDRVLVFSPHNDDEVLGAGELIKKTIKSGGRVKVVLITNGDGFKDAIEFDYLNLHPKPKDYINFGYERQKESISALNMLGLSKDNIIFLGYPDGGISYMWHSHWDKNNPYTSNYTQNNISPYKNSFTKNASYAGESLAEDISKIIDDYKPTVIVYPHPNDRHPDHWAANAFVKYVLTIKKYIPKRELLYLVHRGDWPTPMKKDTNLYLVPPAKLIGVGTNWNALDMDKYETEEKGRAIHNYKTQIRALGILMSAFERKNELFGTYNNVNILKRGKADNVISASNENMVIKDPLQDALNLQISRGADISGIYAEISKNNNLHIFIETDGDIEEYTKYNTNMIFISNSKVSRLNLEIRKGKVTEKDYSKLNITKVDGIKVDEKDKLIHIFIPESLSGSFDNLFINVSTTVEDYRMDKTAWRMINNK